MIFNFRKIINFGIYTTIYSQFWYQLTKLKKLNIFLASLGWFSLKSLEVLWNQVKWLQCPDTFDLKREKAVTIDMIELILRPFDNPLVILKSIYAQNYINKRSLFPKFQLIPILRFQVMHDYVCSIAPGPIDNCVE